MHADREGGRMEWAHGECDGSAGVKTQGGGGGSVQPRCTLNGTIKK